MILKFDDFLQEVKDGLRDIALSQAKEFVKEVAADGQDFVDALGADLETWTEELTAGELSLDEFRFLVKGKKDLAEMNALTQAGLAKIRIDRIRTASIDLIVTAAGKMV